MDTQNSAVNYAATVGFFDGVHTGHLHLTGQLRELAHERGLQSMVVTFAEHPRAVLNSDFIPRLLSTPQEKSRRLADAGIDRCVTLDFTPQLSLYTAGQFIKEILHDRLGVKVLLMGHDHRFGHDMLQGIGQYRKAAQGTDVEIYQADALIFQGAPVSSSRIRRELDACNPRLAAKMLGYFYTIDGTVVHGLRNGHKIGFPTANLGPRCRQMQIPADGVYAARATVRGKSYMSVLNVGFRPTVSGSSERTIEAHLLDFTDEIYGESLTLEFMDYIRKEHKFSSLDELGCQIKEDCNTVRRIFENPQSIQI